MLPVTMGYLQLKQLAGLGGDATVSGYYNHMLSLRVNNFSKDTPYPPIGGGDSSV